jgi:coiled-coil domain-containing protein 151
VDQEDSAQEQRHVERELERMRKLHDDLRTKSARCQHDLDTLIDSVKDLELDSRRPHMEDNQFTRRIRALENKLDKAMIKYNEAQSIRKTYEQIVKRLKEERIGFDNQLQAIERTLGTKQRDFEELLLLSGDANHAREVALNELDRVRGGYQEERKVRERELRESHQMVQVRRQMLDRMQQREKTRHHLTGGGGGEQHDSTSQAAIQNVTANMIAKERIETRNKIDIFENAFRKIKEATGVSDVNEVIQKIVSQEDTTENLISLTKENASKIETLNEQKRRLKSRVEEIKYSGVGGGHRRKMVDDHEDQLANSAARLERSRLKYERLSKGLIAMKAGVGHLQEKVESVRDEVGGRKIDLADESVAEVLRECELCLVQVMKRYKAALDEQRRMRMFAEGGAAGGGEGWTRRGRRSRQARASWI